MDNLIDGKITVIKRPKDYYRIKDETILVVKETTPDIILAIKKIKGIITEVNNPLCHAAIISREFNKPLLMGIDGATKNFKTGDRVKINLEKKIIVKIA